MWTSTWTRRRFIKLISVLGLAGLGHVSFPVPAEPAGYYRIVVLGDPHLPVKARDITDSDKQRRIIEAKNKIVEDINAWDDVNQIVVVGDIVGDYGSESEYSYARRFFERFEKPVSFITGNHDYIYTDEESAHYKKGDRGSQVAKLLRFKETFGMSELFYSQKVGNYFLVFLSVDSLESPYLAQTSERQLDWLREEIKRNRETPTIIFHHAPLRGSLSNYNSRVNTPSFIAQPEHEFQDIIRDNRQIMLWVSGHTHTPASNPDFAAAINLFEGRVVNVHNADMNRTTIWTNSLYLYPDRIVIKTFNHREKLWIEQLDRIIPVEH